MVSWASRNRWAGEGREGAREVLGPLLPWWEEEGRGAVVVGGVGAEAEVVLVEVGGSWGRAFAVEPIFLRLGLVEPAAALLGALGGSPRGAVGGGAEWAAFVCSCDCLMCLRRWVMASVKSPVNSV